jgi:WD40 repeat protein
MAEEDTFVVEEVTLTESDEDFAYESVDIDALEESEPHDDDYEALINAAQAKIPEAPTVAVQESKFTYRHESTDDFVRNFLVRLGMARTLETFQAEWYELKAKGKLKQEDIAPVPDVYLKNQELRDTVSSMRAELEKAQYVAEKAKATWDKLRKERDFHRMHHHRVQQEKQRLCADIDKLKKVHETHEAKYRELSAKYEAAMKEKMLMKLERDRLRSKAETLEKTMNQSNGEPIEVSETTTKVKSRNKSIPRPGQTASTSSPKKSKNGGTPWPADNRPNPYIGAVLPDPVRIEGYVLKNTYKAHQLAISCIAIHPRKPVLATVSDDHTWKLWSLNKPELIFSGMGHSDWVSGCAFHPKGSYLATTSGDHTIKIWDFMNACLTTTLNQHSQAVWGCDFHDTGDFLVSASNDHSLKVWDMNTFQCRGSYRDHVDSVNFCKFQPYTNSFCSASGDKTVSLWDMRASHCTQTFYGHLNTVNHATFNARGDTIASCDSDGVVKIWDTRMVREKAQFDTGQLAANASCFDRSGVILVAASEDANLYAYNIDTAEQAQVLRGHEAGVQDVLFDMNCKSLVTAGNDGTFRIWE